MCTLLSSDEPCLTYIFGHCMRLCMTSYTCVIFWDVILKVPVLLLCKGLYVHLRVIVSMVPDVGVLG